MIIEIGEVLRSDICRRLETSPQMRAGRSRLPCGNDCGETLYQVSAAARMPGEEKVASIVVEKLVRPRLYQDALPLKAAGCTLDGVLRQAVCVKASAGARRIHGKRSSEFGGNMNGKELFLILAKAVGWDLSTPNEDDCNEFIQELIRRCREDGMTEEEIEKWLREI